MMDMQAMQKKLENYWYHYKWHTIAGALAALLFITLTVDYFDQEDYDASVLYATTNGITNEMRFELEDRLEQYLPDFDGNGESNVLLSLVYMPEQGSQNYDMALAGNAKLMVEFSEGESMIFIMDEAVYRIFDDPTVFAPIEEGQTALPTAEGYRLLLGDTYLYDTESLQQVNSLAENFMVLRSPDLPMVSKNAKSKELYRRGQELWNNILTDNRINPSKLHPEE